MVFKIIGFSLLAGAALLGVKLVAPFFILLMEKIFFKLDQIEKARLERIQNEKAEARRQLHLQELAEQQRTFDLLPAEEKEKILSAKRAETARREAKREQEIERIKASEEAQRLEEAALAERRKPKPMTAEELKRKVLRNIVGGDR